LETKLDYPKYHQYLLRAVDSAIKAIDEGDYRVASLLLLLGKLEARDAYLETFCEPPCKSE